MVKKDVNPLERPPDVVSENLVLKILSNLTDSIDKNTASITNLIQIVNTLIHHIDDYPKQTFMLMNKHDNTLESIHEYPEKTYDSLKSHTTFMKVGFAVVVGLFTITTFIFGYFGISVSDLSIYIKELTSKIEEFRILLSKINHP